MSVSDMGGFHDNKGVFFGQAKKIKADFLILEFPRGKPHSQAEAGEFYSRIYRSLLPERIYEQMVKIS